MTTAPTSFCPSCGEFVDTLDDATGWCRSCLNIEIESSSTSVATVCVRCLTSFDSIKAEFICSPCKTEEWANEIEQLMVTGNISFTRAAALLAKNNQAHCLACGAVIVRGTRGRHLFHMDSEHPKCKSASRRVKHLRLSKGLTREQAIETVLGELNG